MPSPPHKAGAIEIGGSLQGRVKRAEISAVVTRADGTVEDLGVIAFTDFTFAGRVRRFLASIGGLIWRKS